MADFKAGDRVVKMSGFSAGKYGTVNSVLENGTLNVTFDGERLPKYCDPMRCGQVAANANVKVGDKIVLIADAGVWRKGATGAIVGGDYLPGFLYVKFDDGSEGRIPEAKMAARNARALNWNYRNSYQFFCVDPSMKAPCIYSGWDYREDAKDDAAELKELGIPHKIVSRRFLEQNGIDPNDGASWKKNR